MERNMEAPFVNKELYDKSKDLKKIFPETQADVYFESELSRRAQSKTLEFIRKDNYIRDSLLMLFEHDQKTFVHSVEMGNIAEYLIANMGEKISLAEANDLLSSCLLHDYGKLAIEKELLNKTNITLAEKEELKKHVVYSFESVRLFDEAVAKIIVGHHEHQKDSYPRKQDENINYDSREADGRTKILSRLLSMIDTYEAMLADRPNNPPKDIKYVVSELEKQFNLPNDQEMIFLLAEYYYAKNKNQQIDAIFN